MTEVETIDIAFKLQMQEARKGREVWDKKLLELNLLK